MSKEIEVTVTVTMPDGYEYVEHRSAEFQDVVLEENGDVRPWLLDTPSKYPCHIVRKIQMKPWKPVEGEEVWRLTSDGWWRGEEWSDELCEEFEQGFIFPESTSEAERKRISAAVRDLLLRIHAIQDGVAR